MFGRLQDAEEVAKFEVNSDLPNENSNPVANSEICTEIGTFLNSVPFDSILVSIGSLKPVDTSLDTVTSDEENSQHNVAQSFDKTPNWWESSFLSAMSHFLPNKSHILVVSTVDGSVKEIAWSIVDLNTSMLFSFPFDPGLYILTPMNNKVPPEGVCFNMSLNFRKLQTVVSLWNFDRLINAKAVSNLVNCYDLTSHKLFEINSLPCSWLVARLLICQYVNETKIGVEDSGIVESSCPIYKLLEKSIDTSLLYSFDGAFNQIKEQYLIDRLRHFLERRSSCAWQFYWEVCLVSATEFIHCACGDNCENDGSYGVLASYHTIESYNDDTSHFPY